MVGGYTQPTGEQELEADDDYAGQRVPEHERQARSRATFRGGDSEQQLMLPFGDALPFDTATGDDQFPVVKSISQDNPIRRIVIFSQKRLRSKTT